MRYSVQKCFWEKRRPGKNCWGSVVVTKYAGLILMSTSDKLHSINFLRNKVNKWLHEHYHAFNIHYINSFSRISTLLLVYNVGIFIFINLLSVLAK